MGALDPNQTIINKSVPALIDWGQWVIYTHPTSFLISFFPFSRNLFVLAERFETDAKSQITASLEKEVTQPETCSIRITMSNIYEKVLFFLNTMTHSYIDYSRSESPMSASVMYECQVPSTGTLQRFRTLHQQQQYRRWQVNFEKNHELLFSCQSLL